VFEEWWKERQLLLLRFFAAAVREAVHPKTCLEFYMLKGDVPYRVAGKSK
jgi:hypothetical protein